jgi:hypothetical protein
VINLFAPARCGPCCWARDFPFIGPGKRLPLCCNTNSSRDAIGSRFLRSTELGALADVVNVKQSPIGMGSSRCSADVPDTFRKALRSANVLSVSDAVLLPCRLITNTIVGRNRVILYCQQNQNINAIGVDIIFLLYLINTGSASVIGGIIELYWANLRETEEAGAANV